jgi:hypothetical protein
MWWWGEGVSHANIGWVAESWMISSHASHDDSWVDLASSFSIGFFLVISSLVFSRPILLKSRVGKWVRGSWQPNGFFLMVDEGWVGFSLVCFSFVCLDEFQSIIVSVSRPWCFIIEERVYWIRLYLLGSFFKLPPPTFNGQPVKGQPNSKSQTGNDALVQERIKTKPSKALQVSIIGNGYTNLMVVLWRYSLRGWRERESCFPAAST